MKYQSGAAFRQALEQRLLTRSRDKGISLVRLRKAVVFDRLLFRLAITAQADGFLRERWPSTSGWENGRGPQRIWISFTATTRRRPPLTS